MASTSHVSPFPPNQTDAKSEAKIRARHVADCHFSGHSGERRGAPAPCQDQERRRTHLTLWCVSVSPPACAIMAIPLHMLSFHFSSVVWRYSIVAWRGPSEPEGVDASDCPEFKGCCTGAALPSVGLNGFPCLFQKEFAPWCGTEKNVSFLSP